MATVIGEENPPAGDRPRVAQQDPRPDSENGTGGSRRTLRKRRRFLLGLATRALLALAVAYVTICGYMVLTLTKPSRLPFERVPAQYGLAFESVSFPSRFDALRLDGWLLPTAPGAGPRRPVVVVHGKGSDRQREADGRILEIAGSLVREGHPVLLFDLRGSGLSGGERFTLGAQEVRDVGGAIDFLAARGLAPRGVNLLGYSMGAATSMLVAAGDPRVQALAEDSGYGELGDVLEDQVPKASGLPPFFTPGVVFLARPLIGVDAYSIRPIDAVPSLAARGVPLLVIHGEADTTVPVAHGRRLVAAYGPRAETYFVPGAEHVRGYKADPTTYLSRLTAFFRHAE